MMNLTIYTMLQDVAELTKTIFAGLSSDELRQMVDSAGRLGEAEGAEDEEEVIRMIAADIVAMQFVKISAEVAAQFNEEMGA